MASSNLWSRDFNELSISIFVLAPRVAFLSSVPEKGGGDGRGRNGLVRDICQTKPLTRPIGTWVWAMDDGKHVVFSFIFFPTS